MATLTCSCGEEFDDSELTCPGCDAPAQRVVRPPRPRPSSQGAGEHARADVASTEGMVQEPGRGRRDAQRCQAPGCGQAVPVGEDRCLYCQTPVGSAAGTTADILDPSEDETEELQALLPATLRQQVRVIEPLPAGGAEADLFIVEGPQGHRSVLKLYRRGIAVDTGALELLQSADVAHVVRIEDHGPAGDRYYELLEFIEAGHLRDYQQRRDGKVRERDVLKVLEELADALEHLHGLGLRHGDVKPENILVRKDTRRQLDLVFTDFGLAAVVEHTIVHSDDYRRSVLYSAPEQLTGVQTKASDIWGLGVVVLELLLGRHPLADPSDGSMDPARSFIDYRFLTQQWPIPPDLIEDERWQKLFRGVLHPVAERRWRIDHVQAWLKGEKVPEVPDPAPPRRGETFAFVGRTFTSPAVLADALLRNWEKGRERVARGDVRDWVRARAEDEGLERYLDELPRQGWDQDGLLLRVALRMNPELEPVYRGAPISIEGLRALASNAVKGPDRSDPDASDAAKTVDSLIAQHGLKAVADLTGSERHARLASELRDGLNRLSQLLEEAQRHGTNLGDKEVARARYRLLHLLTDPEERATAARRVRRRQPRDLPPWYSGLLQEDAGPADLVVASAFRDAMRDEARRQRRQPAAISPASTRTHDLEARLAQAVRIAAGLAAAGAALLAPVPTLVVLAGYAATSRYRGRVSAWFTRERASRWTPGRVMALPFSALGWVISAMLQLIRDLLVVALAGGVWLAVVLFFVAVAHGMVQPSGLPLADLLRRVAVPALAFQAAHWLTKTRPANQPFGLTSQLEARIRSAPQGVAIAVWVIAGSVAYAGWSFGVEDPVAAFEDVAVAGGERLDVWAAETFGTPGSDPAPDQVTERPQQGAATEVVRDRWRVQGVPELNVREQPGLESPVMTRLREGQIRVATGNTEVVEEIEWVELELPGGRLGWASQRYLERVD